MKRLAVISIIFFIGCYQVPPPDFHAIQRAGQLVDQGVFLLREGQLDKSESAFKVSLEISPSAAALDGLGCVAFLRGDLSLAEGLFNRAIGSDNNYYRALANLALVYDSRGEYEKAKRLFEIAIANEPDEPRMRNNFAVFIQERNKGSKLVKEQLLKAERLIPHPLITNNINEIVEEGNY